jgi:predicted ATPase/DNA-binding XRE family transcriptional regulator
MDGRGSTVGDLLKLHRAAAGLTQEDLAERAEVSARTISDVERGLRTSIYRDTARRLTEALGLIGEDLARFERAARGRREAPRQIRSEIPVPPTPLIGRDHEVDQACDALSSDDVRLLTLTGPGGIGKTRIAIEAAARLRSRFDGNVFFVPLGGTEEAALVPNAIAHAVGVTWTPVALIPAIVDQLGDTTSLLVLDTFEHLLAAAPDVAEIMASVPALNIMVTSREALRIRGEHEISIPTLDTPDSSSPEDVADSSAGMLFFERARAVDPDLILDDVTARMVAAICRRLDGLPLALELAAARAKHFPLVTLLEQLENKLTVLTGGPRDLPKRQQTMRDTVGWSFDLLDQEERLLFAELSVFAGGWTIEAASAVCTAPTDLLHSLSALLDKSLIRREPGEGRPRYGMLDVIREFAAERLPTDVQNAATQRHAAFFTSLAQRAELELGTATQDSWFQTLAAEQENARVALRSSINTADAETALRLTGALWQFWRSHGDLAEGRSWLREALALGGGTTPERAKALWGAAWLAYHQGDYEEAEVLGDELRAVSREAHDPVIVRNALTVRGMVAMARAHFHDARALFEEAVALLRPLGRNWLLGTSLLNLGSACVHERDAAHARAALEEARAVYDQVGDRHFSARATIQLGFAFMIEDDVSGASALIGEGLRSFVELDDAWGTTEGLEAIAAAVAAQGLAGSAARLGGAAQVLRSTLSVRPLPFDAMWTEPYMDRARAATDPVAWSSAWNEGSAMSLDDAIDLAFSHSQEQASTR